MDPAPVDELGNLVKLINTGGSGALVFLALLAWQVWKGVRATLQSIAAGVTAIVAELQAEKQAREIARRETREALEDLSAAVESLQRARGR